jgi:hypothetical protein
MTKAEAREYWRQRADFARKLARIPRPELVRMNEAQGVIYGHGSKDQLVGSLLCRRFPLERENEAVHVLAHDVTWPDCEHCQARELVWCELVNAPAHDGKHVLQPNCRHAHFAGHPDPVAS